MLSTVYLGHAIWLLNFRVIQCLVCILVTQCNAMINMKQLQCSLLINNCSIIILYPITANNLTSNYIMCYCSFILIVAQMNVT